MIFVFVCLAFEECRRPSLSEEQPVAAYEISIPVFVVHIVHWDVEGCGMEDHFPSNRRVTLFGAKRIKT